MPDLFQPLPLNDGPAGGTPASDERGPRRREAGIEVLDVAVNDHDDRIGAPETAPAALVSTAQTGPTSVRVTVPPTQGTLFVDTDLPALLIGNGTGWWKVDLTLLATAGGVNAPQNFQAVVQPDNSIVLTWDRVPGATAITVRETRSPGGVSGMPLAGSATTNTRTPSTPGGYTYWITATVDGVETAPSNTASVTLPHGSVGGTPADILNIGPGATQNHFNVGIGYATGHKDPTMTDIMGGFADPPYFTPNAGGDAVQFKIFANGKTTSNKTGHPRSELREMEADKTTKASWNAASGTHVMSGTSRITYLPPDNQSSTKARPWICFAQIHDTENPALKLEGGDIVRLQVEGTSASGFKIYARTHTPNGEDGVPEVKKEIASSYTVGTDINWKIECIDGKVKIYIDDVVQETVPGVASSTCYFKAGNYQQFSTEPKDGGYPDEAYSAVELRNLVVTHSS